MTTLTIPAGVSNVSAGWLTAALSGVLAPGASVASFESTRIGEGVGFLGELARVRPVYSGNPGPGAPESLIVKLPTQMPEPRAMAALLGFYEREVGFYNEFASEVGVRVPRAYHAVFEAADANFALIFEDVQAKTGDQLSSCTLEEARRAVRELARLHARWWQSPRLSNYGWLPSNGHVFYQILKGAHQQGLPNFIENFSSHFDPMITRCAIGLGEKYDVYLDSMLGREITLTHGDYRLDNLMFGEPGSENDVVVLDWQLCQANRAVLDLQYFISGNLKKDAIAAHTDELLDLYHETLRQSGVSGYGRKQLQDDFAEASLILAFYIVTGANNLSPDSYNERGKELIDTLFGTLADSIVRYEAERFLPA